jgi:hypothetical protein
MEADIPECGAERAARGIAADSGVDGGAQRHRPGAIVLYSYFRKRYSRINWVRIETTSLAASTGKYAVSLMPEITLVIS